MKLVHKATGAEVKIGDEVFNNGGKMIVSGFERPRSPASSGRIYVVEGKHQLAFASTLGQGYFPPVYECEWIEREDRV